MVAILAVCLDWIYDIGRLHLHDGTNRSYIPHQLSRRQSGFLWYMGLAMASLQQGCNGLCEFITSAGSHLTLADLE